MPSCDYLVHFGVTPGSERSEQEGSVFTHDRPPSPNASLDEPDASWRDRRRREDPLECRDAQCSNSCANHILPWLLPDLS